jgi:lupus La protein
MKPFESLGLPRIADALRKSPTLLKVSADGTTVRRLTALQPPGEDLIERSSYAKGFPNWPEEEQDRKAKEDALQPKLEAFFADFGPVRAVRMRREGGPSGPKGGGEGRKPKAVGRFKVCYSFSLPSPMIA